jgi:hypothetical protein
VGKDTLVPTITLSLLGSIDHANDDINSVVLEPAAISVALALKSSAQAARKPSKISLSELSEKLAVPFSATSCCQA